MRCRAAGYDTVTKEVEQVQTDLCTFGIPELALEYTTAHDDELVEAALRLVVALLDGGTRHVQLSLLKMLRNSHDGRVFLRLRKLMVRVAVGRLEGGGRVGLLAALTRRAMPA